MLERSIPAMFLLLAACAGGEGDETPSTFSDSFTTASTDPTAVTTDTESDTESSSGDGDGDPSTTDPSTTDPSTGDGDGDPSGDGDGDPSGDGDGDGDEDPCPQICDGMLNSTPNTCDDPYVIGRSNAKSGFFYGGSTQAATNEDTENCGPHDNPDNLDTGADHFFRIWLELGDTITVTQNPNNWHARLKIHDEADCVGNAKECTVDPDPATIEYEAPKSDWFTIVVDGRSLGLGDQGDYSLTVDLVPGPTPDMCSCP